MLLFCQLYLAHLLADFVFQPDRIAQNKRRAGPLAAHAAIHAATSLAAVNLGLSWGIAGAILTLSAVHLLLDIAKARYSNDGWVAFAIDQATHVLLIAAAAAWLSADPSSQPAALLRRLATTRDPYLYLAGYIGVVLGGGYFVQRVARSFLERIDAGSADYKPGLPNAGRYIGWVERFLILTFVLGGYSDAIGFLLAAKALARYPEISQDKKGHFAEYFLIGTLTSVGLALIGGMIILRLRDIPS